MLPRLMLLASGAIIGAAIVTAFLLLRDRGDESFDPRAVGEQAEPGTPVSPEKVQEAREFKDFPLWWLGESSQSLALTMINEFTPERGHPTMNSIDFIYGTCKVPPGGEGCTPPLSIQVEPICHTLPVEISGVQWEDLFDFRGAKALWVDEIQLGIWTGDSAVFIFGTRDGVLKAADEIIPLGNVEVELTDSKLPPPNFAKCPEPLIPTPIVEPPTDWQ